MLYISSPDLIHLIIKGIYPFDQHLSISPTLQPYQPPFYCFSEFDFLKISHIREIMQYLSFYIWPISVSIISKFIHVVTNGHTSLFTKYTQTSLHVLEAL